jgi:hypothetical protein
VATILGKMFHSSLVVVVVTAVVKIPEGLVVGFQICAWAPNLYK